MGRLIFVGLKDDERNIFKRIIKLNPTNIFGRMSGVQESNHELTAPIALNYRLLQVFLTRIH